MTLYVANCTKQNVDFIYRAPESMRLKTQQIPMGGQQLILSPTATTEQLQAILVQHEMYGLVDVKDIDRTQAFIGLCYSFDKPVDVERIQRAHAHNEEMLVERGVQNRKEAAAALSDVILKEDLPVTHLEVETIEVQKRGENGPTMSEKIEVVREGYEPRGHVPDAERKPARGAKRRR